MGDKKMSWADMARGGPASKLLQKPAEKLPDPPVVKSRTPSPTPKPDTETDDGFTEVVRKKKPRDPSKMTKERSDHVRNGGVIRDGNGNWVGTGYHHRPGGRDRPGRRTTNIQTHGSNGVYSGDVEMRNPDDPSAWVQKGSGRSTFYPDSWDADTVDDHITDAFNNGRKNPNGTWSGKSGGISSKGYYDTNNNKITNGFPDTRQ